MDQFLALLSGLLSARSSSLPLQALQRVVALANPWEVEPELIRAVLRSSDPESMAVFRAFLALALAARPVLSGVDLETAVRGTSIPVAAVVGARDIFAPPPSVDPLLDGRHAGPRRVVALPRASHVDLTVGRAAATAVGRLVGFWEVP